MSSGKWCATWPYSVRRETPSGSWCLFIAATASVYFNFPFSSFLWSKLNYGHNDGYVKLSSKTLTHFIVSHLLMCIYFTAWKKTIVAYKFCKYLYAFFSLSQTNYTRTYLHSPKRYVTCMVILYRDDIVVILHQLLK